MSRGGTAFALPFAANSFFNSLLIHSLSYSNRQLMILVFYSTMLLCLTQRYSMRLLEEGRKSERKKYICVQYQPIGGKRTRKDFQKAEKSNIFKIAKQKCYYCTQKQHRKMQRRKRKKVVFVLY